MTQKQNIKICLFIHYSISDIVPYYVEIYINQLSVHFDEVKVLTNNKNIGLGGYFFKKNVCFWYNKNRGYDFGMFYQFLEIIDLNCYSQIACINDSNILLNKLDKVMNWGNATDSDFWGIIDSDEKPWFSSHSNNYHIQSHFMIFNKKAIEKLPGFFRDLNVSDILNEKNIKKLRRLVIDKWEIGLSQYFLNEQLKVASFIESKQLILKYQPKKQNLTHSLYYELAAEGYPLLKKKVVWEKKKGFKNGTPLWMKTMRQFGNSDCEMNKIIDELLQAPHMQSNYNLKQFVLNKKSLFYSFIQSLYN